MSLTARLKRIEDRITALEGVIGDVARNQAELAEAIVEDEPEQEPERTLDGHVVPGERDQDKEL
jgi:hypothetical protein